MSYQKGQDHDGLLEGVTGMGKNLRSELRTLRRIVSDYPKPPFTREDVRRLREIAAYLDTPAVAATEDSWALTAIADRIEVLLPAE